MELYDVIALKKDYPKYGLIKGQRGAILEIYNDNNVEVEFCDSMGITLYLGSFCKDDLDLIWSNKTISFVKNE